MSKWAWLVLAAGVFATAPILAGCGGSMVTRQAVLNTPGVTIRGDNFVIESGRQFEIPFLLGPWQSNSAVSAKLPEEYKRWLGKGARRVSVTVDGREQPLYGVMTFHTLYGWAKGPATRSFSVRLDDRYIQDASDGRIAVIFELASNGAGKESFAWVLWLSDRPF
jgi:hypothetical protein